MARVLRRDVLRAARWASATARCDSCRPQLWEIAAAMVLAPTGAAGGRTWYVARALQRVARVHGRVAGHQLAVVWSYLGRFLTRVVGGLTRHMAHTSGALSCASGPLPRRTWYASSRTDVGRGPARSHARLDPPPGLLFRYKRRSTME